MTLEHQYLSLCNSILNNGYTKNTRNGSTKSIFGFTLRHNMADGFPLLTTKKVDYKNIVSELLWFLRGDTNIKYLLDHNNNIWVGDCYKRYKNSVSSEWEQGYINELYEEGLIIEESMYIPEDKFENITYRFLTEKEFIEKIKTDSEFAKIWGDIGPGYGAQWRKVKKIKIVEDIIQYRKNPNVLNVIPKFSKASPEYKQNVMGLIGKSYTSNSYGKYTIINEYYVGSHLRYDIQFELTNYIQKGKTKQSVTKTFNVRDPYYPRVYGVACLGETDSDNPFNKKIRIIWEGMISRCYNIKDVNYYLYGEKGIYVEDRWLLFSNFLEDISRLEGWNLKLKNWEEYSLDKDYKLSNCYGPDKCVFLSKIEQTHLSSKTDFIAIDPSGNEYICKGIKEFSKKYNLNPSSISNCLSGRHNTTKGWCFRKIIKNKQYVVTENIDQISNLINDLKNNPDSRRLLVSAWNVGELDSMLLPPCHYSFQCYTRELTREERWNHLRSLLVNFPSSIRIPWDSMSLPSHEWLDDVLLMDIQNHTPFSKVGVPRRSISLIWNQRSVDVPLGLPFNIASYATLLTILGKLTNMVPETLIGNLGDCHIYSNQIEGIKEQLTRSIFPSPKLSVNSENWTCVEDINPLDFKIEEYESHPRIYFPLSN